MTVAKALLVVAMTGLFVTACSDDDPTGGGSAAPATVDDLLARVCDLAGDCGGSVLSLSDSDVTDPLRDCALQVGR